MFCASCVCMCVRVCREGRRDSAPIQTKKALPCPPLPLLSSPLHSLTHRRRLYVIPGPGVGVKLEDLWRQMRGDRILVHAVAGVGEIGGNFLGTGHDLKHGPQGQHPRVEAGEVVHDGGGMSRPADVETMPEEGHVRGLGVAHQVGQHVACCSLVRLAESARKDELVAIVS